MTVRTLPRPRTFEDMCDRLQGLETEVAVLSEVVKNLATNVGGLIETMGRIPPSLPPKRSPEDSFMGQVPELQELKNRVRDPNDRRFTSDYARALVRNALEGAAREKKAGNWDGLVKVAKRVAIAVVIAYAVGVTYAHFGIPH
jgi:hypothetical protein